MAHELRSTDGVVLEHRWDRPHHEGDEWATVVALHPHPAHGGDLHNTVVATLARRLPDLGIAVLRINVRGTGASGGVHDGGRSEHLDVAAAIGAAVDAGTEPVVVAGYSFGADVALACLADDRVAGWALIAPPCSIVERSRWQTPAAPVLILRPRHDQYAPHVEPSWPESDVPVRVEPIEGGDHFLAGRAEWVADRVGDFIEALRRGELS